MKVLTTAAALEALLKTVKPATARSSTLPALECIRLEATGDDLRAEATDLDTRLSASCEVIDTDRAGAEVVPMALYKTVQALPDDTRVTLSADDDHQIRISTERGSYEMAGYDPDLDWPDLPEPVATGSLEVSARVLRSLLERTAFAMSDDPMRPAMAGLCITHAEGTLRCVATDGHRLSRIDVEAGEREGEVGETILPARAVTLLTRLLKSVGDRSTVAIATGDDQAIIVTDAGTIWTRLVADTYPDYEGVIPSENDRRLVVQRADMLNAVKRVGLYSSSMTNQIRLSITSDAVTIAGEDVDRSAEAEETIRCDYDGEDMDIGFNSEYLTEVLDNVDVEDVVFELGTPNRAGIVFPREQAEDENILMLIMPVMLNSYA